MTLLRTTKPNAESKDDGYVSSPASLSSASIDTLNVEETSNTQPMQLSTHTEEAPPSYEDVTSVHSSQHDQSLATSSSNVAESCESLNTVQAQAVNNVTHEAHMPADVQPCVFKPSKVKIHEGNFTLHSSETIIGAIVITGNLQVHSTLRVIGSLEVRKSFRNFTSTTVDGDLRITGDVNNHGMLHVSETTAVCGKLKNHGRAEFAKHVAHSGSVTNHGSLKYNDSVDFGQADMVNHGTITVGQGARNVGKVRNHGKLNGMSSL